jgi:hypothetical protein
MRDDMRAERVVDALGIAVGMSLSDAIGQASGGPCLGQCQILVPVVRPRKATPVRGPSAQAARSRNVS